MAPAEGGSGYGSFDAACDSLGLDSRGLPADQFEALTGVDIDEAFAYDTKKFVSIRDARLGILRSFLMLGIGMYVIFYQLMYEGGYLKEVYPTGTVDFYLRQRGENNGTACDVSQTDDDCKDVYGNVKDEDYCTQSLSSYNGRKIACRQQEYSEVEKVSDLALFCTSRTLTQDQEKVCSVNPEDPLFQGGSCDEVYHTNSTDEWYVSDIEDFVVFVRHSYKDEEHIFDGDSDSAKGRLKSSSDALCGRLHPKNKLRGGSEVHGAPCYIVPNNTYSSLNPGYNYDEIDLNVLLQADKDMHLDRYNSDGNGTYRETGVNVYVQILYNNREFWKMPTEPAYEYIVKHAKGSNTLHEDTYYSDYPNGLTIEQNYGVKINFVLSGTFYVFDSTEALIRISTALTLFAVASFIVDSLAMYVLRHRREYLKLMFEPSQDFGELVEREKAEAAAAAKS